MGWDRSMIVPTTWRNRPQPVREVGQRTVRQRIKNDDLLLTLYSFHCHFVIGERNIQRKISAASKKFRHNRIVFGAEIGFGLRSVLLPLKKDDQLQAVATQDQNETKHSWSHAEAECCSGGGGCSSSCCCRSESKSR